MPNQYTNTPILERALARFQEDANGCWLWTGRITGRGYGQIRQNRRALMAHRIIYEGLVGPIPEGLDLDHLCRNRRCVNPEHLEPVSHKVNVERGDAGRHFASRTHCSKGHAFDEANTYIRPNGVRGCRACRSEARRQHYRRNVEGERERMRAYYQRTKNLRIR